MKGDMNNALDVFTSAGGIGDAVCALYAAAGAAATGKTVCLHTKQAHWLSRASFPGVEIVTRDGKNAIDMNADYSKQLGSGTCRKQWYADNIAREFGIETFAPVAPFVDRAPLERRIDADRYVVFAPFAAWHTRTWPGCHWARLAHLASDAGFKVIAIDGPGDGKRMRDIFGSTPAKFFWGHDHGWVIDCILGARAVVANDSGIAHLAGMMQVPTVAVHAQVSAVSLFTGTSVLSVTPRTKCAGCGWKAEKGWRKSCDNSCSALAGIDAEKVFERLQVATEVREVV